MKSGNRSKKKIYTYSVDESMSVEIENYATQTGAKKSEMSRRAMRDYLDGGADDAAVMLNLVLLTQVVNELKDSMEKEKFESIQ